MLSECKKKSKLAKYYEQPINCSSKKDIPKSEQSESEENEEHPMNDPTLSVISTSEGSYDGDDVGNDQMDCKQERCEYVVEERHEKILQIDRSKKSSIKQ